MNGLRKLVKQYTVGESQFPEFRRAFVTRFLAIADKDPVKWSTVMQMESEFDDFAEGVISEDQLKLNLTAKLNSSTSVLHVAGVQSLNISGSLLSAGQPIAGTTTVPAFAAAGASGGARLVDATLSWEPV